MHFTFTTDANRGRAEFPSLTHVGKYFVLESSETVSSRCANYEPYFNAETFINGSITCDLPDSAATSPSDDESEVNITAQKQGHSGLQQSTKIGLGVGLGLGGALMVAIIAFFTFRAKQRRANASAAMMGIEKDGSELDPAHMLSNGRPKYELEQPTPQLPAGNEAQELAAEHGEGELGRNPSSKAPPGIESRHEAPGSESVRVAGTDS